MGTELQYKPGSFYRICDRTGFAVRAGVTRKEWTGHIVRDASYEPRQPQDLVRGVPDDQTVPEPRPRSTNVFLPAETQLTANVPIGTLILPVQNIQNFSRGDLIAVVLDNGGAGVFLVNLATQPVDNILVLARPMPWFASSGNTIRDYTYQPPTQVAPNYPSGTGNGF